MMIGGTRSIDIDERATYESYYDTSVARVRGKESHSRRLRSSSSFSSTVSVSRASFRRRLSSKPRPGVCRQKSRRARHRVLFRGDVVRARLRAYHDAFANRTTFDATPSHRSATANTPFTLDRLATVTKTAATSGSRAESFSSARRAPREPCPRVRRVLRRVHRGSGARLSRHGSDRRLTRVARIRVALRPFPRVHAHLPRALSSGASTSFSDERKK